YRDARISTIYEGTTGIQGKDLIGRKIARDNGTVMKAVIAEMRALDTRLAKADNADIKVIRARLAEGVTALAAATDWLVANYSSDIKAASAGAVPFLNLLGTVAGGWQMARAALVAHARLSANEGDAAFYQAKLGTARYYADYELSQAAALKESIVAGAAGVLALDESQF
ncbi:MAG: acyl-CoA dehydrogenase, partial [Gammaproteobacteria bacterium]